MDLDRLARDFSEQGFCRVDSVLSADEVAALRRVTERVVASAVGLEAEDAVFDLEDTHRASDPRVRRIKKPHQVDPLFAAIARHPRIVALLQRVVGPDVRLHHSKVNMKSPRYGAPLEWHQDWAFIPHSNMSMAIAALMLDDVGPDNGPVLFIPGSHRGPLMDHHHDGYFAGAIDPAAAGLDIGKAVPVTGKAGSISLHHVRTVHGSRDNLSDRDRPLLLFGYVAADAWPLRADWFHDLDSFNAKMLRGKPTLEPRLREAPVRMPYPPAPHQGSIFENQKLVKGRSFAKMM